MRSVAVILAAVIASGCTGIVDPVPAGTDPDLLRGGQWTLVASSSRGGVLEPLTTRFTVRFEQSGRFGGSAGPNGYGGIYDASMTGAIQVDSVGATKIGGPEAERAGLYLSDMLRVERFAVDSTTLYLYHDGSRYLRFTRED